MKNPRDWIQTIEQSIRSGRARIAKEQLVHLIQSRGRSSLPREDLSTIAAFCRRVGVAEKGVLLLHPIVRDESGRLHLASPREKMEYAACLVQIGARAEAEVLLQSIDSAVVPLSLLHQAFILFFRWQHVAAIPLLRRLTRMASISPYERRVAEVNLASALLYDRSAGPEAHALLEKLLSETSREKNNLLQGNLHEIRAQLHYFEGRYTRASASLDEAERLLCWVETRESFYVQKWRLILDLTRNGWSSALASAWEQFRDATEKRMDFETLRDLDFHRARLTRDLTLAKTVWVGTPYPSFRDRIRKEILGDLGDGMETVEVLAGAQSQRSGRGPCVDFANPPLKPGQALWRLFVALAEDRYHRKTVPELFLGTFPGRYFNPETTPVVVHQLIHRLRLVLKKHRFGVKIGEVRGKYGLALSSPGRCVYPARWLTDEQEIVLHRFKVQRGTGQFTSKELASVAGQAPRSAQLFLRTAVKRGLVKKTGSTRSAIYTFCR